MVGPESMSKQSVLDQAQAYLDALGDQRKLSLLEGSQDAFKGLPRQPPEAVRAEQTPQPQPVLKPQQQQQQQQHLQQQQQQQHLQPAQGWPNELLLNSNGSGGGGGSYGTTTTTNNNNNNPWARQPQPQVLQPIGSGISRQDLEYIDSISGARQQEQWQRQQDWQQHRNELAARAPRLQQQQPPRQQQHTGMDDASVPLEKRAAGCLGRARKWLDGSFSRRYTHVAELETEVRRARQHVDQLSRGVEALLGELRRRSDAVQAAEDKAQVLARKQSAVEKQAQEQVEHERMRLRRVRDECVKLVTAAIAANDGAST